MPLKNESGNTLPIEELYIRFDLNNKQKGGKQSILTAILQLYKS